MRICFTSLLLMISIYTSGQNINVSERLDYFKKHKLFVVRVEFEHKRLSKSKLDDLVQSEKAINRNLRKCIESFWTLNDSVVYIDLNYLKQCSKDFKDDVFLTFYNENFYSYMLRIPGSKNLLNDISPRMLSDTALLDITQEIRQLQYNVVYGNSTYHGAAVKKQALILDEAPANNFHRQFIEEFKRKHPGSYKIVNRDFLMNAVLNKDPRYVYVYKLCVINIEDGSLLQI
jgi:hypothetical protein